MKHLKYFESDSITDREKVETIVEMYEYLCANKKMDNGNFIGNCTYLFMDCKLARHIKGSVRMFDVDVDTILGSLDKGYSKDRRDKVDELYKFAKEIRGKNTPEHIEEITKPLTESDMFVAHRVEWFYRTVDNIAAFVIELDIDPELFEIDEKDVMGRGQVGDSHWLDDTKIPLMKRLQSDFYTYRKMVRYEIDNLELEKYGFRCELHDSSHWNQYYQLRLLLLPIK